MEPDIFSNDVGSAASGKGKTRQTQCKVVRAAIEHDIVTGTLPPGAPLDEEAISRRFSVSRTPVREALLQLIESGLIKKSPRQPAVVAPLDVRLLVQSFEVMSEMEALCAKLAARRISPEEKEELAAIQRASDAALAAGDHATFGRLGNRFHLTIWQATHNEVLVETARKCAIGLNPYRMFQLRAEGRATANNEDHQALLELILAGRPDEAYNLMKGHVSVQGDVLAEYISYTHRANSP
ncbi:MAG: GntR family transcriptional regulator [Rhodoferax sp.]|nr:GntR family transcriptional regulator [Rhodoferax sp.]